jgi:Uma2 family endonuclease
MGDITTRIGMPLDRFIEEMNSEPFEIINREKRAKQPKPFGENTLIRLLFFLLETHTQKRQVGEVYSKTPFILTDEDEPDWVIGSRTPDVMFYARNRMANHEAQTATHQNRPLSLVPDLLIEVILPTDGYSELDEKIDAYLLDGVRLIWVLNPQRRKASVHAPDLEQPIHLKEDGVLDGGDVIPGFKIALSKLFE